MKRNPFIFLLLICCGGAVATQLYAQPVNSTITNHVLQLDGVNSCLELPAHAFDGQQAITVEAWVKWQSFGSWSRVFDFGKQSQEFLVGNVGSPYPFPTLTLELWPNSKGDYSIFAMNVLELNEWVHVAAGSGRLDALVNWARQARGSDVLEDDLSLMELEL